MAEVCERAALEAMAMSDLSWMGDIQHSAYPCEDNPQPCGCVVCCCELCQGVCHHMAIEDVP